MQQSCIEKINGRSCTSSGARLRSRRPGLSAIANGWLALHESGTFVKFTEAGAALFT